MMKKIMLSLFLTTCYYAMENDQLERETASGTQMRISVDDSSQRSIIFTLPNDEYAGASVEKPSKELSEQIAHDAEVFWAFYTEILDIYIVFETNLNDQDLKEIKVLFDFQGTLKEFFDRNLVGMSEYIVKLTKTNDISELLKSRQKVLDETKKAIKVIAAIAMHINRNASLVNKRCVVARMRNKTAGRITRQLKLIVLFGDDFVRLDLVTDNLMRTGYHIRCIAEQLRSCHNAATESMGSRISDFRNEMMIKLIRAIQDDVEKTCETQLEYLFNSNITEKAKDRFSQRMRQMVKRIHKIEGRANELICKIYSLDNLNEHSDEITDLINLMRECCAATEICYVANEKEADFSIPSKAYSHEQWTAITQNLMLHSLSREFPWLTFQHSFFAKAHNSLYKCFGFTVDSCKRSKEESKCTFVGEYGDRYDAHSVTVKCEWAGVEAAFEQIIGYEYQILIIQTYLDGITPVVVFSGVSGIGCTKDRLKEVVGLLAHNLPNNLEMNDSCFGGAQVQLFIDEIDKEDIMKTLKTVTEFLSDAKSPCFLDNMKQKPGLSELFDKGVLVIGRHGINLTPRFATVLLPNTLRYTDPYYTVENLMDLIQAADFTGSLEFDLKWFLESSPQIHGVSNYYQSYGNEVIGCLQQRIEQLNSQDYAHAGYASIGIALKLEFINEILCKKLSNIESSRWYFHIGRAANNYATHIVLLFVNCFPIPQIGTDIEVRLTEHKMMQEFIAISKPIASSDSGSASINPYYISGIKKADIIAMIRRIKNDPTYFLTNDDLKYQFFI